MKEEVKKFETEAPDYYNMQWASGCEGEREEEVSLGDWCQSERTSFVEAPWKIILEIRAKSWKILFEHICVTSVPILYPLKTPENQGFSSVFQGVKMGPLPRQGLPCRFSQAFSSDCALILESIWNFCNDFGGRYFPVRSFQAICGYSQSGNRIDQLLWSWLTLVFRTTWWKEKGHCNLPITVWALSQNL